MALKKISETKIDVSFNENAELRKILIERCEAIVHDVITQLCAGQVPNVSYRISSMESFTDSMEMDDLESPPGEDDPGEISEPRNVVDFARNPSKAKLSLMMTVIATVHNLLITDKTETRRSLFYELKGRNITSELINNQKQIDVVVSSVANLLECSPWNTGLVGTARGLAAGDLTLSLANNDKINYDVPGGALIPQIVRNVISIETRADRVIVVEKDTVFQKLLQENCPSSLNCILVTGKGYPDVPTRMLVKVLAEKVGLPVYVLVDADPYGMEIMFNYKYGSAKLCRDRGSLACPSVRWIGVFPSELPNFGIPRLELASADVGKLNALYCRPYVSETFARELELMRNGKAEIEAIPGLASMYLPTKIGMGDYV